MKKEQIPMVLYFYLHQKVGEPAFENGNDGMMPIVEVGWRMFQWKIPDCLKPAIIKVWENMGLIKRIDRRNVQFKKTSFDINDLREVNKGLGII